MKEKQQQSYSIPFRFRGVHGCEAVVLACIDFRFWKETARFVEEYLGITEYDFPKLPGSAKAINGAKEDQLPIQCIDVSCRLHEARKIIVINHSDCGAYGGVQRFEGDFTKEENFHKKELSRAREKLERIFPKKEIIIVFAALDANMMNIQFKIF